LEFVDDRLEVKDLLKKENEFQLMDFLIKQSEKFAKAQSELSLADVGCWICGLRPKQSRDANRLLKR
jgi:hypothetical protein